MFWQKEYTNYTNKKKKKKGVTPDSNLLLTLNLIL